MTGFEKKEKLGERTGVGVVEGLGRWQEKQEAVRQWLVWECAWVSREAEMRGGRLSGEWLRKEE